MNSTAKLPFRVGTGYDFHPFKEGRKLILGGIHIPHPQGLEGHSDADALLHATMDALLGAAGLRDVGHYFPDSDVSYQNISSLLLLEKVYQLLQEQGFRVGNIDLTVVTEKPEIGPHVEAIKANLARTLDLQPTMIGIKATTMEGQGPIGRGEGLAVQATVLITQAQ
ncbi:MAG: 2-C-methyl-D-erythritol 2,4-cyclodiphosphate synthase [Acidobacteriota bacterium]|nr:2-C-methyl-D-erythritol 2,4-cyclodiphosphate synthase [Acidobacteriota bacterium]